MDLSVQLPGLNLKNPVIPASGTFGFGREFSMIYDLSLLGGCCVKSITPDPRAGNPLPRIAEAPSGMINAIGLQNRGVEFVKARELPFLEQFDTEVIANVAGASLQDYALVIEQLRGMDVIKAFELNISCPNVSAGGMAIGTNPELAAEVTRMAKAVADKPVYVKLSPNVTDITKIAQAVEQAGADGIVLINTVPAMRIDLRTAKPLLGNVTGGLSGPAIKPIAIRAVYLCAQAVNIPIIGCGGITCAEDVLEFLYAGASAVEIGSENLVDPWACPRIIDELPAALARYRLNSVKEAIGKALPKN
ncbi:MULTISPECIES: dihydroorotate dehydrogenase [Allobaculum]|uniref:dihydroorotate dehydrogenase n=1 Tax=Allobaculum TaxID=174708 RepID=UPI001E52C632|nr:MULTISPECIES: dihydroorotate dehydrogenase [Allobaculum]UNT93490.1 dihydroorotate dehydrogenase [Allobaculum sp. Allo2]